ncbi:hypothetical protein KAT60_00615 [Candidatus Woesebacteria bacterium]|nr:hypothetical protein [Candidatus Woesebacteria bacterium]
MKIGIFVFVLLGNFWIWKILFYSAPLGLLVLASSVFLYLSFKRSLKKYFFAFLVLFSLLLVFQWKTTSEESLVELSNDEQRVQQMRLKEYPPVFFKIGEKTAWIPLAHWFEGREESIAFFRILENFSETIDPNLYFFANHPRERVGVNEFKKFPYIFLPLFFYGLVLSVTERRKLALGVSFILPVFLVSIIGHKNQLGPFSLFPFLVVSAVHGLELLFQTPICKKILKR